MRGRTTFSADARTGDAGGDGRIFERETMRFSTISFGALLLAAPIVLGATPAFAQDTTPQTTPEAKGDPAAPVASEEETKPITVTGGVTLISDYRFRGLTQTDGASGAAQGTVNVNSSIGFYVGTWASTIDGDTKVDRANSAFFGFPTGSTPALTGYGSAEVDLYGGFTKTFSGVGVDVGLLYYFYPDAVKGLNTDFFEPYASVSYTLGPVAAKAGAAYAWGGQDGLNFTAGNDDNIYVYGEGSIGVPKTPITLKGHVGYTNGSLGLVNLRASNDEYVDWSATAEAVGGPFKVGVSYVDTSISSKRANFGGRNYRFDRHLGRGPTVLAYVGFTF